MRPSSEHGEFQVGTESNSDPRRQGRCEEIERAPRTCPPGTRVPPSSPPWKRGDDLRSMGLPNFFTPSAVTGERLIIFLRASYWSPKICQGRLWLGYWQCSCPFH